MKKLIVAAALVVAATPANARSEAPLLDGADGRWAIDNVSNCYVPSKAYTLNVNREIGIIMWQDGLGNTDIERVVYSDEYEFRTMTVNSFHPGHSNSLGTGWIYSAVGFEAIRVTKFGKPFYIVRCRPAYDETPQPPPSLNDTPSWLRKK